MAGNLNPNVLETIDWCNYSVGSVHIVEVIHINDPASFYVRPVTINATVERLEARGNPITEQNLKIRQRVVYNSVKLQKYVRGEIMSCSRSLEGGISCSIQAIDYGCCDETIPLEYIYLPASNMEFPSLALHCKLNLCEPRKSDTFDKEAIEAMKFFVGKHPARMTVAFRTADKLIVDLRTAACPDGVATMLSLLQHSTLHKVTNAVNRFEVPLPLEVVRYDRKEFAVGDKFNAIIQNYESYLSFHVAELSDYKKYIRSSHEFTQYCKHQPPQDVVAALKDGRCCGVRMYKFPSNYERAIVRAVMESSAKAVVKLVDLGVEMEARFEDIKYTPSPIYAKQPMIAIHCTSTEEQIRRNRFPLELRRGFQFEIEIVELGDGLDVPHKVNMAKNSYTF